MVNAVFGYVLAVAARRYGILLHAFCVLSNHFHIVLTDPRGQLPIFEQFLNSLVARALNAWYGRWENLWAPGSFSAVALASPEDILDKAAYTLANPAAAGLVERGCDWQGLWSAPEWIGGDPDVVARPDHFFSADGQMPKTERLELVVPEGFPSVEAFRAALMGRIAERERAAAHELREQGRRFRGVRRVNAQRHTDSPSTVEPRRRLDPRVASHDKWKRIEALARLKTFLVEYREAFLKFRTGLRDAVFPEGTYLLRVSFGVACAGSG